MARLNSTTSALPSAPQSSHTPQVKKTVETVVRLSFDPELLEILKRFDDVGFSGLSPKELRESQREGVYKALAWAALSYLNSKDRGKMRHDLMSVNAHLRDKLTERREVADLEKLLTA